MDDPLPGPIPARVVRVIDGDTVRVRARIWLGQEVEINVRLAGVDAPEKHTRCDHERELGRQAQTFIEGLLTDERVTLVDIGHDKYGKRVVAHLVNAGGKDLSGALLSAGLAHPYDGRRKQRWCPDGE